MSWGLVARWQQEWRTGGLWKDPSIVTEEERSHGVQNFLGYLESRH